MKNTNAQGLPARIYLPIVIVAAIVFIGIVVWFLRIGIAESGSVLAPSEPIPQSSASPGRDTR